MLRSINTENSVYIFTRPSSDVLNLRFTYFLITHISAEVLFLARVNFHKEFHNYLSDSIFLFKIIFVKQRMLYFRKCNIFVAYNKITFHSMITAYSKNIR